MSSGEGNAFSKSRGCPSAQHLLQLLSGELPSKESEQTTRHLNACDFCAAELQFLASCPIVPTVYEPVPMPDHLRRLAEGLLGRSHLNALSNL